MTTRELHVGIVGPGSIADAYLAPALAESAGGVLWSVLSRDLGRAEAFAQRHGARAPRPAFTDLGAMLADPDLDAVIVASPDRLHAPQAIAAARAGKHVLVEKPMATSVDDARAMVDAAKTAGVVLAVAYHLRWHAGHRALAARLHAGDLGVLHHLRVQWTWQTRDATNWRAHDAVGRWWALGAVGTHALDLARWLMRTCGEIVDLKAVIGRDHYRTGHDETAAIALRFASGATAEILASVLFRSPRRIEVFGSTGAAVCDETLGPHGAGTILVDDAPLAFSPSNPYVGELEDFFRAVRDGAAPEVDGAEGLRNVELLVAACP